MGGEREREREREGGRERERKKRQRGERKTIERDVYYIQSKIDADINIKHVPFDLGNIPSEANVSKGKMGAGII